MRRALALISAAIACACACASASDALDGRLAGLLAAAAAPGAADAAVHALADAARGAAVSQQVALLEAIAGGGVQSARGVVLERLADGGDALAAPAIAALRRLGARPDDLPAMRSAAQNAPIPARCTAMLVLADLGDLGSAPALIDRLGDPEPALAGCARLALEKLSGRSYGSDAGAWRAWHRAAEGAADASLPQLAARLRSADPAEVKSAIARLTLMRAQRAEAAELVAPLVGHADPSVAGLARLALGTLRPGGGAALGDVVAAPSAEPAVAASASTAVPERSAVARLLAGPGAWLTLGGVLCGCGGAIALLVFAMRTREPVGRLTRRITRSVVRPISEAIGRTAKRMRRLQERLKRITFTS